jgi:RNA polymerase sigma-70 factor, ECF subfamily
MAGLPDASTVARARDGDSVAMEQVLSGVRPVLVAFFVSRIGRGADAQDLAQNTLIRLNRAIPDINDPSSLKALAMRAAVFELQDFYRGRNRTREQLFDPHDAPESGEIRPSEAESFDIERALSAVTPHARRVLELRAYGYQFDEIAEMVGSSQAAVKMQVKRAMDKIRDLSLIGLIAFSAAFGGAMAGYGR